MTGEGEKTVVDLAEALSSKKPLKKIEGIGYKENGEAIINKRGGFIKNLDNIDWSLINVSDYVYTTWSGKRVMSYIASRGCPHNCLFCHNLSFYKRTWRKFPTEQIIKDIRWLVNEYKLDGIMFDDDNFFPDKKRAFEILENIGVPAYHLEIRIDYITEEVAEKLSNLGCKWLLLGVESGNDRILKTINKGYTVKDVIEKIKILAKYPNICVRANFMLGLPTETWKEVKDTINLILNINKIHPNINCDIGLFRPYPGTPIYDTAIKLGFKTPSIEGWGIYDDGYKLKKKELERRFTWSRLTLKQLKKLVKYSRYVRMLDKSHYKGEHPNYVRIAKLLLNFIGRMRFIL